MANALPMGPPLSPRETRRSGRRSNQSSSSSKSPASPTVEPSHLPPPRPTRENSGNSTQNHRPVPPISNGNGRNKRPKQEDTDDAVADAVSTNGGAPAAPANGRGKRKTKDKPAVTTDIIIEPASDVINGAVVAPVGGEEEPSVTRCVCGSTVDEEGEFMVQCETCEVWQHGLCVGYEDEGQVASIDYYCEQCRPDLHQDLLKQLAKKARQSSANSHHNPSVTSRLSRSHSPSHLLKPAKRRNTMNSRDAAFDESLKEIIEATAAEAATHNHSAPNHINGDAEAVDEDGTVGGRKKRKRTEDDTLPKKRTRSASSASDHVPGSTTARDDELPITAPPKSQSASVPVSRGNTGGRKSRGGRKSAVAQEPLPAAEVDEGARPTKPRTKPSVPAKRPLPSSISHAPSGSASHEHGTRRNQPGVNGSSASHAHAHGNHAVSSSNTTTTTNTTSAAEASRAYRNSHAYAVSQQPLFTSWNLPDYLAHLEPMLPTDTPRPLEVRGSGVGHWHGGRESLERGLERGAKVKWPSKRMSVGDMNKRVRALVEWLGREQAGAMDRGRRREALEKTLREHAAPGESMTVDSDGTVGSHLSGGAAATMKQMEELMEELIGFQERFGPGAKISNERGRRIVSG